MIILIITYIGCSKWTLSDLEESIIYNEGSDSEEKQLDLAEGGTETERAATSGTKQQSLEDEAQEALESIYKRGK